ncbi:MAG: glycoside hydrolase family 95 protein, partial [Flavobacterium sp.]
MRNQILIILSFLSLFFERASAQQNLKLWYNKPASRWEETIPLGNGRLGMMPDGGITRENIVLNDITLWSGAPQDANNYEAHKSLEEIRKLILEGKNDLAQDLVNKNFICKGEGSGGVNYGCFQVLGNLSFSFSYPKQQNADSKATAYHRELSLNNALAKTSFILDGVRYTREYLTSFDDDVNVVALTASKPGKLNFDIEISRPERAEVTAANGELVMSGQLDNGIDGKGMKYS